MEETYPIKILLVDDKPENLLAIESILDEYTLVRAHSATETLKILLKEDDFALILMDVNMPEMNGFDTAAFIYRRERLAHIPIIFITSNDYSEENLFKGYMSGGVDYIFKPVNTELLKIKVRVFIDLYKKNRQLLFNKQKLKQINADLEAQIKEKLKIEKELKFRNIQLSDAQKLTHIGSWEWNILSNKINGSEEIYDIYEIEKTNGEFGIDLLHEKIHPDDREMVRASLANAISNSDSFDIQFRYLSSPNQIKFINKKGKIITNERSEVVKIFGTSQDITDIKRTEEQLKIFSLFEKMMNEIYIFSEDEFKFLYANADALRNLNYTIEEIKNFKLLEILKNYNRTTFKAAIAPLLSGKLDKIVLFDSFKRKDNSFYPAELHLQLIEQGGKWESLPSESGKVFLATVLDLTERKRTEKAMAASLHEKELLLQEIHHRVKNNLQVISSLLNIQKSFIKDEGFNNIIEESRDRIRSMALLHEKLYQSKDFNRIDFGNYINDLASELITAYSHLNKKIMLEIESDHSPVTIDLGISLGLILNELISNCIKHAFKEKTEGTINIYFRENKNRCFSLRVKDNGNGFAKDFDFENTGTLGLEIVRSLADQIDGRLSIHSNGGAEFEIEFPNKKIE
jgi:PAS domain S-box-containing protein